MHRQLRPKYVTKPQNQTMVNLHDCINKIGLSALSGVERHIWLKTDFQRRIFLPKLFRPDIALNYCKLTSSTHNSYSNGLGNSFIILLFVVVHPHLRNPLFVSGDDVKTSRVWIRGSGSKHVTNMRTGMNFQAPSTHPNLWRTALLKRMK